MSNRPCAKPVASLRHLVTGMGALCCVLFPAQHVHAQAFPSKNLQILAGNDMRKFFAQEGAEPWPLTPQQLDGLLVREIDRYRKAAQIAGIPPQ